MTQVYFEGLVYHDLIICEIGLGLKVSGIMSYDSAKSLKLLSHNLQAPSISLFHHRHSTTGDIFNLDMTMNNDRNVGRETC